MRIVAFDTTSIHGSIALYDGTLVEQVALHSTEGFSKSLYVELKTLLERHSWQLDSVSIFAAAAGPGSFTGVRVGLTASKGLAEAIGAKCVAVSNLKALAALGTTTRRAVLIDARRGEVYGALYNAGLEQIEPEIVMPFRDWAASIKPPTEVISSDLSPFRELIPWKIPCSEHAALAAAVAKVASTSVTLDPAAIDANYVRRSDAELFWKDR